MSLWRVHRTPRNAALYFYLLLMIFLLFFSNFCNRKAFRSFCVLFYTLFRGFKKLLFAEGLFWFWITSASYFVWDTFLNRASSKGVPGTQITNIFRLLCQCRRSLYLIFRIIKSRHYPFIGKCRLVLELPGGLEPPT